MPGMALISYENRIVARTSPDVMEGLGVLLARLQRLGWKFGGRKIGQEGLVGAAMLEFLSMSEAEQVAILGRRIPELERQLDLAGSPPAAASAPERGEPVTIREITPGDPPSEPYPLDNIGVVIPTPKPAKPKRSRRQA